jgi:hypothetical protein
MEELIVHPREIAAVIDRERKVIMDWSPKSGCTIAVKMFFKQMGLLEEALAYHEWVHEYRMKVFKKNDPTTPDDLKNPDFYKFKVVRNPYTRVVSSYIHTMKHEVMHQPVKKVLRRWNANISFKRFVDYLGKIDLTCCDPHYALQQKFFEREEGFHLDRVIKLEEMVRQIERLNKEQGYAFDLEGISSHHHIKKDNALQRNVARKRYSRIKDAIPHYQFFYNDAIREKVSDLYRADIETYGYTFEEILPAE